MNRQKGINKSVPSLSNYVIINHESMPKDKSKGISSDFNADKSQSVAFTSQYGASKILSGNTKTQKLKSNSQLRKIILSL